MTRCRYDEGCESQGCTHTRRSCPRARQDFLDTLAPGDMALRQEPDGHWIEVSKGLDGRPERVVQTTNPTGFCSWVRRLFEEGA